MKINLLLLIIFLSLLIYAESDYFHGIVGMTLRDGGTGCVCHDLTATPSVNVWIEGPDSLTINQTVEYKIFMTGGPAVKGGFNVANSFGSLNPIDTLVSLSSGELTHSAPNPFINDTVSWIFSYTAPDSLLTDTLFSVGNSVNGNGNPSQDQWNFGENFLIHIIDDPVSVTKVNSSPQDFILYQNYPNPFNPTTNIKFLISDFGFVSLKIYDVLGNEVVTLVDEYKSPGEYEVKLKIGTSRELSVPSGVYFYQLRIKVPVQKDSFGEIKSGHEIIQTKKMVLLK